MQRFVVIVAGGKGLRLGGDIPKQFRTILGVPVLMHTIIAFYNTYNDVDIRVVLPNSHKSYWAQLCQEYNFTINHTVISGGETRWESVKNGLQNIPDNSIVAVHDGVRPIITSQLIERAFNRAEVDLAVIPTVPLVDSIRKLQPNGGSTVVNRADYALVQTPQVFNSKLLKAAYSAPYSDSFTDDASVVEAFGAEVKMIDGDNNNIKITTAKDLKIAELLLSGE